MSESFKDKKAKVIVVDPSGPVRQMMSDVVRGMGFEEVSGQASIQDTLSYLETEEANWVLCPLQQDQPANALHLVKICTENPPLKGTRISLMVEEEEEFVLPHAFELGLLSWHSKPFTKDSLPEDLGKLLARLESTDWQEPLTSAMFLRDHLNKVENFPARLELEKSLVSLYPGDTSVILNLAEPHAKVGNQSAAKAVLHQVKTLDSDLESEVEEIAQNIFGEDGLSEGDGEGFNVLGLKKAVVIDTDEAVRKAVEEILTEIGVEEVAGFSDGEEAWSHMDQNDEPDLIIHEWRIPRLTGPMLVQKIRQKGFHSVPLVVLSSLIKKADMPLVREMGIANIINKPLNREDFLANVVWTIQQERLPTEKQSLELKFRCLLASGKTKDAEKIKAEFLGEETVPLARKRLMEGLWFFHKKEFVAARSAAVESLKQVGDSILTLNLLGKTFMALREYDSALKCFKRAQELSPHNIERLCNIAESQMEIGDEDAANEAIEEAKALDEDNAAIKDAEIKVAIAKGDTDSAKQLMGKLDSLSNVVAYMNNKAVAHAKCGYVEEAIELYEKTIQSIPDERQDTQAIVNYNMALSLVKHSEFEKAVAVLERVLGIKKSRVRKKAESLKERLEVSIERGTELELKQGNSDGGTPPNGDERNGKDQNDQNGGSPPLTSEEDMAQMIASVEAKKGDLCCYLVYHHPGDTDVRVTSLFAKQPKFQLREAIEREEAMGAERETKSA